MTHSFDVAIIGGGPGGYVTAIRAAQLGLKTVVIEREHMGGICLNWGCIPTKALLRSSEIYHLIQESEAFGISVKSVTFDLKKIVERSRAVSAQLTKGIHHLMKKNKVTVIDGHGKLAGKGTVQVTGKAPQTITAKHIILATGARARVLPGMEPDGHLIWSYREAMVPDALPKSLVVMGSGAIGIEFASFYATLGVDVTIIEVLDRILPVEDAEISALARKAFEKRGIKILTGAKVEGIKKEKNTLTVTVDAGGKRQELTVDRLISAVGIVGNVEDLGLETTKIKVEKTHILTNEWCQTEEPDIYAIGDVAGAPWLAHKASHEGIICVEKIAGLKNVHPLDPTAVPGCTYATPQVASVGLTEDKAKAAGHTLKIGRFPYMGNGKALALGEPDGLIKTIFDANTGEFLGAHMIGAEVTELIQGFCIAKKLETTEEELMHTIFPHPTLSEMMHESVLDAYGRVVHM